MHYRWHSIILHDLIHRKEIEVGGKTVGMTYNRKRPDSVELDKADIQALVDNPNYLKHILSTLRNTER